MSVTSILVYDMESGIFTDFWMDIRPWVLILISLGFGRVGLDEFISFSLYEGL